LISGFIRSDLSAARASGARVSWARAR
jgi:hypothetical protein